MIFSYKVKRNDTGRLFKQCGSLCHTHNLNDSHNNKKWSTIISLRCHYFLTQPHNTLTCFSYLGKVFKIVIAENRLLHSSCCTIGDLPSVVSLAQNNSPVGKVSTVCWIYLQFPVTWLQQLLVFVVHCMRLHCCAQGSYLLTDAHASANQLIA